MQRLTAICAFIDNEIPAFESYFKEFEDPRRLNDITIKFNVNDLRTEQEVLQWYIDINSGGTPHSKSEIDKVKSLISKYK